MIRVFPLGLLILSLIASCSTEPRVVEDDVVNTESFVWAAGNTMTWESTSVNPAQTELDTTTSELMRRYTSVDTTFEEWTNHALKGYWGRTIAVQFDLDSGSWFVQGYYPTLTGETWNRANSMALRNENGDTLSMFYLRIRTETADTVITTPAGSFRCAKYVHEWFYSDGRPITTFSFEFLWYAPRVGLVQTESWYTPYGSDVPERTQMHRLIKITR